MNKVNSLYRELWELSQNTCLLVIYSVIGYLQKSDMGISHSGLAGTQAVTGREDLRPQRAECAAVGFQPTSL